MNHLQVPIYARALGDEMRALDRYLGADCLNGCEL